MSGGYLCYSPDSLGTLYLHWSKIPVDGAIAYFEPGKAVPGFKYTTNQGRCALTKGVDDRAKFFEGWSAFLKEALCRFNAKSIAVYDKNQSREDVQIVLLKKDSMEIERVEDGDTWEGDVTSIHSFAVVPKDNVSFKCGTLQQNLFLSKAKMEGAGYCMLN